MFIEKIKKRYVDINSILCVGLGPNPNVVSKIGFKDKYFEFNKAIINATHRFILAYKPQIAYYSALGKKHLKRYAVDAVTVNPYMGMDQITPFTQYEDKAAIVLAKTSNAGSRDFQELKLESGERLYEYIVRSISEKYEVNQILFVVGATFPEEIRQIRSLCPKHYFLVPVVGSQGGKTGPDHEKP